MYHLYSSYYLMCLNNETLSITGRSLNIINSAENISSSCLQNSSSTSAPARLIRWNNNHVCTILNVDGSCLGDPIHIGFGGVIRNHSGKYISGFSGFINNSQDILFAELSALHQGLELTINLNYEELACYSDSLLTANLIKEEVSQFHVYAIIIQDIKDLLRSRNLS